MRCINCDEPASKCACDPAVLRDAWEDRAVNAEARAEAAEARVKELEAENHRCWQARDESDRRITQLEADLQGARTVVDAAWRWLRAGENDPDRGERTALERAFAAIERTPKVAAQPARTINAHALVADAFVALAEWVDKGASGSRLEQAYGAVRAAGIRLDVVRTLSKQEAEALYEPLEQAIINDYINNNVAASTLEMRRRSEEAWDRAHDAFINALMGVPVPGDAERLKRMEDALRDFAKNGTRHDVDLDTDLSGATYVDYMKRMEEHVVATARAALEQSPSVPVRAPPVSQGHDEAGGEGAASAYDEVMERVNAHQVANAPQEDAGFLIDDAALGAEGDSLVTLIRAVRLINAKVDTLARRA